MHTPTRRTTALTVGLAVALASDGGRTARAQESAAADRQNADARLARVTTSVDVGGASVAYDDFLRSSVISAAPAVRLETTRAAVVARGALSQFESGRSAVQGSLTASAFSPEVLRLRGELYGTVGAARYTSIVSATNLYVLGRLHAASPRGGAWLGLGRGFVSQSSNFFNDLMQVDLGAWAQARGVTYTLTATPTRVGTLDFVDWVGGVRWQHQRGELAATAGTRRGRDVREVRGVDRWIEGQGTVWLGTRFAIVGGLGLFPVDVVQGLPGGRYASAALRIGGRRRMASDPRLRAELTLPYELERLRRSVRPGDLQLLVTPDGVRRIRLVVRDARRVELMADFTDWTPVPFAAGPNGLWELELFISPGVHRVNVRVDGGAWRVPPGLTAARDEFGSEVGLLVVP